MLTCLSCFWATCWQPWARFPAPSSSYLLSSSARQWACWCVLSTAAEKDQHSMTQTRCGVSPLPSLKMEESSHSPVGCRNQVRGRQRPSSSPCWSSSVLSRLSGHSLESYGSGSSLWEISVPMCLGVQEIERGYVRIIPIRKWKWKAVRCLMCFEAFLKCHFGSIPTFKV